MRSNAPATGAGTAETAPEVYVPRVHRAEVSAVRVLGPGMSRVTFAGDDLRDYPTTGIGDEYVRLFFPDAPDDELRMPVVDGRGWSYPDGVEPLEMRTYTIRDRRAGEIDIDFVLHDGGIAAEWAKQASPGQAIALNPPTALYERPAHATHQLLVADEPALPAALRIAELTAGSVATTIIAEVRSAEHELLPELPAGVDVRIVWVRGTGNGHAPSALIPALRKVAAGPGAYVWVAGEARLTREARKHLRHELGLPADAYKCIGYWTERGEEWNARYEAQGPEFDAKFQALYDSDRDIEDIIDDVSRLFEAAEL